MLCVVKHISHDNDILKLLLSDGWYCINAELPPPLSHCSDMLQVGTKIRTLGAVLEISGAMSPLDQGANEAVLKLSPNATIRAPYDTMVMMYNVVIMYRWGSSAVHCMPSVCQMYTQAEVLCHVSNLSFYDSIKCCFSVKLVRISR